METLHIALWTAWLIFSLMLAVFNTEWGVVWIVSAVVYFYILKVTGYINE